MTENLNPKVDAYIAQSQPFAQPIMAHLRETIHKGCPEVEETIKWSRPFFVYRGAILCNIAAFKEHCSFGFWGREIDSVLEEASVLQKDGSGSLGRITTLLDLPSNKQMLGWIRQAAGFITSGTYTSPIVARRQVAKAPKPALEAPVEFTALLKKNKQTARIFSEFSPSCKREYIEWITNAKRPETRDRRVTTAIEWISEGKQLNHKYQNR